MSLKNIAEKMKVDKSYYDKAMAELKVKNPELHKFIQTNQDKFYELAEGGKLDAVANKKMSSQQDEASIRKVF